MKLNILGTDYAIFEISPVSRDECLLGKIDYLQNVIYLEGNLSKDAKNQTLMHEIIHAICGQLGFYDLNEDETTIQGLATGIYQVLKQNDLPFK